jgi:hypothetical protein
MPYGDNATVQKTVFGATDSTEDSRSTNARTVATYYINSQLGLLSDLTNPDNETNNCANLLAAGIVASDPKDIQNNVYWIMGEKILENLKSRSTIKDNLGGASDSFMVEGFHRNLDYSWLTSY